MENLRLRAVTFASVASFLVACSDMGADRGGRPTSSGSDTGGAAGPVIDAGSAGSTGRAGSGMGGSSIIIVSDASFDSTAVDATCAGSVSEAKLVPLDLFIMLDQSTSMSTRVGTGTETRWTAVTKAIGNFV